MTVMRILLIVFLFGIWGQAASACPEGHVAVAPAKMALEIAVPAVAEDFVAIGGEHRCECPATMQDAQSIVSNSTKSLLPSYAEGSGAFPNQSDPISVAPAERDRASSFFARPSGRPPHLLVSRLRQ